MTMDELKNNKMFWVLIVVTIFNIGAFVLGKVIVDRAADRVIQKLQKDYSPSPYGPGLDPDKVNPEALKVQKAAFERRQRESKVFFEDSDVGMKQQVDESDKWRGEWEKSRGANQ
jgi:hypothetical protein